MKKTIPFLFALVGVLVFIGLTVYAKYYMPPATAGTYKIGIIHARFGMPEISKIGTAEEATRDAQENIIWAGILPLICLIAMGIITKQKNWRMLLVLVLVTTLICLCIVIPSITHPLPSNKVEV